MSLLLLEYQKKTLIIQTKVYVIITFRVSEENTYHTDQNVCHYYLGGELRYSRSRVVPVTLVVHGQH